MFILLFIQAWLLLGMAIKYEENPFLNIIGSLGSSVTWLILSLSQMQIELPYIELLSTDNITTGVYTYTSDISPYLTYYFVFMFIMTFIYWFAMIWDKWYNYKNWHKGY